MRSVMLIAWERAKMEGWMETKDRRDTQHAVDRFLAVEVGPGRKTIGGEKEKDMFDHLRLPSGQLIRMEEAV